MTGTVYYLSYFVGEKKEVSGFLFPDELPENYYSPGLFLLLRGLDGNYNYKYKFDAMDNGNKVSFNLVRATEKNQQSSLYVVNTDKYGYFLFNLMNINPSLNYIGNRSDLFNQRNFSIANSTDSEKLERVCHESDFYFIGRTLGKNNL